MRGSDVAPLQDGREHLQLSHMNVSRFFDFDASSDTNDVIGAEDLASLRTSAHDVISEAGGKRTDRSYVTLDWSRLSGVIYVMIALDVLLLLHRLSNLYADVTCRLATGSSAEPAQEVNRGVRRVAHDVHRAKPVNHRRRVDSC